MVPSISSIDETATVQEKSAGAELHKDDGAYEVRHSSIGVNLRSKVEAVEVDSRQISRDCLIVIGREFGSQS